MPSRDVNAATRLAEASWRRDKHSIIFFSERTFNARSGKRMFYETHVLRRSLHVRKTCVNERKSYVTRFTCLPCVKRTFNMRFTHVAHFPTYMYTIAYMHNVHLAFQICAC